MDNNKDRASNIVRLELLDQLTLLFAIGLAISLPFLHFLGSSTFLPAACLLIFSAASSVKRAPYSFRVSSLVALFVALGVMVVIARAEPLAGRLWIVIAATMATVLIGFSQGVITLVIGSLLLFLPYFWFSNQASGTHPHFIADPNDWLVQVLTGFIAGIILIYATAYAFNRLVRNESRVLMVADNAVDIIWSVDMQGNYTFMTPSVEATLGYTVEEMLTRKSFEFVTPETVAMIQQEINKMTDSGTRTGQVLEYQMIKADGGLLWTENSFRFLYDDVGEIVGISGVTRDISERKEAEVTRQALQTQLQQSQKMESIGQLAGGVAHDFNNLLSVIIGNTELLQNARMSQSEIDECIADISKAGESAKGVAQQLLTFSRNDPVTLKPVHINELIQRVSTLFERLLPQGIELNIVTTGSELTAICDQTMMEQTLVNLVVNARDAIEDRGVIEVFTGKCHFDESELLLHQAAAPGDYVSITVSDNGCGIPEELQSRIFEPFFTLKAPGEGTGLGLSVIFGIIQQHHGFIQLDSAEGTGSRFSLFIPAG